MSCISDTNGITYEPNQLTSLPYSREKHDRKRVLNDNETESVRARKENARTFPSACARETHAHFFRRHNVKH